MIGGCIPVIIQDHVHAVLDDVLDYPSFSLRLSKVGAWALCFSSS